ncbi:MAG: hypothetical protein K8J31_09710, partial [Anaerolineae bacterium]|nr:hypothetical protein [Anaerolineae bacterium]
YLLAPTARNWTDFGLAYGQFCFHHFRSVWYPQTFVRDLWEQQLMTHPPSNYAEILRDPGFEAIAAAIHFATTGLLWRTQRPQNPQPSAFRIRYGLDRDLLEHARDPARFIGALSEFLRTYAWDRERLRVNNLHHEHWPPEVTDEHFYRVVALVDQHGSELVARLLVTSGLLRPERS